MSAKWDARFLDLCDHIAEWSRDPSSKVGAVIVRPDKSVASMGFNGFPQAMPDSEHLYNDRECKYPRIIHAEMNALLFMRERIGPGYTLYTSPYPPCSNCAKHYIQAGIKRVVAPDYEWPDRWVKDLKLSEALWEEAGVELRYV